MPHASFSLRSGMCVLITSGGGCPVSPFVWNGASTYLRCPTLRYVGRSSLRYSYTSWFVEARTCLVKLLRD